MKLPYITVVTPCLDAAATIEQTLASVRSQDYPLLEHLVIDGGSTDGTLEILSRAESVRVVSEPDGGRAEAADKGLRLAAGEVVGWLNADDLYEPGALIEVGRGFAQSPEAEWVTGYCRIVDGEGREVRRAITAYKNALLRRYSLGLHLTQNFVSDPATFGRRDALLAAGPLDPALPTAHDYDLWLRLARNGPPVVLRRTLASFRMSEGTLSMAGFERQFVEHAEVARRHGEGHRTSVAANRLISRAIVAVYRVLRARRRLARG